MRINWNRFLELYINYSINQNYCYILIIPGFGIISTVVAANSNKSIFGYSQNSSLINITLLTQRTIFGEIYSIISFIIYLLLLNNPQITKTLSENVSAKLVRIKFWFASIASNDLALKFRKFSLNNSNNFFNSFKKYKMNTNKLHLIHTLTHTHTNTHSLSLSSLNTKLFYSVLQCNKNKLHPYYITGFVAGRGVFLLMLDPDLIGEKVML